MKNETQNPVSCPVGMPQIMVMVHGAWSGPYAWDLVAKPLTDKGIKVIAVQLPGHGSDNTEPGNLTMDSYIDYVAKIVSGMEEPVTLVGHSMSGMIISGVAELIPEKIDKLVYIAAYVPQSGQSAYALSADDKQSLLGASLVVSDDQSRFDIKIDEIINIFCQDGSDEVKKLILDHYKTEPGKPFSDPVNLTEERFGSVKKYFIETLRDNGIGHDLQKKMIAEAGITDIYTIDTGHSPFLSKPVEIAGILANLI